LQPRSQLYVTMRRSPTVDEGRRQIVGRPVAASAGWLAEEDGRTSTDEQCREIEQRPCPPSSRTACGCPPGNARSGVSTFCQLHAVHFHPCCTPYSWLFSGGVPGVSPKLDLSTFAQ
jgi:hypothetical protein